MASSILSVGQSALIAAQVQIATTGHNIANVNVAGYTRQVATQGAVAGQDYGYGYIGKGTTVTSITRVYSSFVANQATTALTEKSMLESYHTQISNIDSILADPSTGISSALTGFFASVQNFSSDPSAAATRQAVLSSANALAASFQTVDTQLSDLRQGVNDEITTSIGTINAYAKQLGVLNDAIEKQAAAGNTPNDLMDQRDVLVNQIAKEVKVSVVPQGQSYNVFIGNGQPLVVGAKTYELAPVAAASDGSRIGVGYNYNGMVSALPEDAFIGGTLGGLLQFRSETLDPAQNELGRLAIAMASAMNAQNKLGQTASGAMGGDLFSIGAPVATPSTANAGNARITPTIVDANALTTSDYRLQYDGSNYQLTRESDGNVTTFASFPVTVDGVAYQATGTAQTSDNFLIRPTVQGASGLKVAITDKANIAAAGPVVTGAPTTNTGTGIISAGSVSTGFDPAVVASKITLTYDKAANTLTGFPNVPVTVTTGGVAQTYAAGAAVPYTTGSSISFSNVSLEISGTPATGDKFTVGRNTANSGDSRNAVLLGGLQTAKILDNGTTSFASAFSGLVSQIGNKTRELQVTSEAAANVFTQANAAQQSVSGVNLDEEGANLLRYQQAYQAAARIIQTASEMFDTLLTLR